MYHEVDFTKIPDKATFYYLSNGGRQIKCTKHGKWGFKYKDGNFTVKRFCPFPEGWYCVVHERTYKKMQ